MTLLLRALKAGLPGLLLGVTVAVAAVILAMIFDPKCGPGDSGGCAMGLVTVPLTVALPGFALFFAGSLARGLWQIRPPLPTIRQLRMGPRGLRRAPAPPEPAWRVCASRRGTRHRIGGCFHKRRANTAAPPARKQDHEDPDHRPY